MWYLACEDFPQGEGSEGSCVERWDKGQAAVRGDGAVQIITLWKFTPWPQSGPHPSCKWMPTMYYLELYNGNTTVSSCVKCVDRF